MQQIRQRLPRDTVALVAVALRCNWLGGGCPGTADNNCYPYWIWAGTRSLDGSVAYSRGFKSGILGESQEASMWALAYAYSVRCVLGFEEYNIIASNSEIIQKTCLYAQLNSAKPTDQLCDLYAGYGALQCQWLEGCPGAALGTGNANYCYPYAVWSGSYAPEASYRYGYDLGSGNFYNPFGTPGHIYTFALTVRCVLDLRAISQIYHQEYSVIANYQQE